MHQLQARRAAGLRDRPAPQPGPRPDGDAQPADRQQALHRRVRGRQDRAGRPRPAGLGRLEGAPVRVPGAPRARPDPLPRHARPTAPRSTPAATRSSRRSTTRCRRPPRSGSTSRPGRRTPRTRRRSSPAARSPSRPGRGSSACAATTSTTPRPPSWTTGPARSSPTSARPASRRRATRSSSPSSTSCPTAGASPGRRSSRSTTSIGIDDKTLTAATMFMDVTTNFGGGFIPTQADKLERGPVRLREALQFSLNIPAIKATIMSGLDHVFDRDQGLRADLSRATAVPVLSMGIGTLEVHPIDLLGAYSTIANGGVLMPRRMIGTIVDPDGNAVWPHDRDDAGQGDTGRQPGGRLHHHRHPGRQHRQVTVNPFWGKWAIFDGRTRRPAAYKTGTTSDNRDVARLRLSSRHRPTRRRRRSPSASGWATATTAPNDGKLSLDTSAPLWSAILTEVTQGREDRRRSSRRRGIVTAKVDAFTGLKPGPVHDEDDRPSTSSRARSRPRRTTLPHRGRPSTRRAACSGRTAASDRRSPRASSTCPRSRPTSRPGRRPTAAWAARAARGSGVGGGLKGTRTSYFYTNAIRAVRAHLGSAVRAEGPLSDLRAAADLRSVRADTGSLAAAGDLRPARPDGPRRRLPYAKAAALLPDAEADPGALELDDRRPVAAFTALAGPQRPSPADGPRRLPGRRRGRRPSPSRG